MTDFTVIYHGGVKGRYLLQSNGCTFNNDIYHGGGKPKYLAMTAQSGGRDNSADEGSFHGEVKNGGVANESAESSGSEESQEPSYNDEASVKSDRPSNSNISIDDLESDDNICDQI